MLKLTTQFAAQVGCSNFQPTKFDQMITHQHVLLPRESFIGGTAVTKIFTINQTNKPI
jgi:hypothetical protein